MSQITVTNKQNQVIDAYIVSKDLYKNLEGVATASSLEFFTVELLEELEGKFLRSLLDSFNLYDKSKDIYWNLNKASFFALSLYPWYQDFTSLLCAIKHLRHNGANLIIKLTCL